MRFALTFIAALLSSPAAACEVALVLAMDVSRSVSSPEYKLQMEGLADAFHDEEVIATIEAAQGGVMATVMIWGDRRQQRQTQPWTLLRTAEDARAFGEAARQTRRHFGFTLTGLGAAMAYADRLLLSNPTPCARNVVDISGDGIWNDGISPDEVWEAGLSRGLTINGLVILGAKPDPLEYYRNHVIGGPGAFVETAADFDDYARAIKRKLLRELSPIFAMADP